MNVIQAGSRGERTDAEGLHQQRHGAQRFPRPAAIPGALVAITTGLLEARPRGAPGRDGPRAVARPEPRHPVRADRRRPRRVDCLSPTSSCSPFWGGARRSHPAATRAGGLQAIMFVVAILLAILAPITSRSSSSRSTASASTWPTPVRAADPEPMRPRAGPGPRSRPTPRCSRPRTGRPGTCRRARSRSSRSEPAACSRPTRRPSTRSTGCARRPAKQPSTRRRRPSSPASTDDGGRRPGASRSTESPEQLRDWPTRTTRPRRAGKLGYWKKAARQPAGDLGQAIDEALASAGSTRPATPSTGSGARTAAPEGQQLERSQHRQRRAAHEGGPDAAGRPPRIRGADRGSDGCVLGEQRHRPRLTDGEEARFRSNRGSLDVVQRQPQAYRTGRRGGSSTSSGPRPASAA